MEHLILHIFYLYLFGRSRTRHRIRMNMQCTQYVCMYLAAVLSVVLFSAADTHAYIVK